MNADIDLLAPVLYYEGLPFRRSAILKVRVIVRDNAT